MLNKILSYVFFAISIAGIIVSISLIIEGCQPCSGDGCLIHIAAFIGFPMLIISAIIFYFTLRNIISYHKEKIQENE
jgi:hypothetical protein